MPGRLQKDWWAGGTHGLGSHGRNFTMGFIKIYKYNQYANDFNQGTDENVVWFVHYNTNPRTSSKMKCWYISNILFSDVFW